MTTPRRIQAAGATFAIVAACSIVWGDSSGSRPRKISALAGAIRAPGDAGSTAGNDAGPSRFAGAPVLTYQTLQGELHFALQVQAKFGAIASRPRDVAVVIDTSASQVGAPLRNARLVAAELARKSKAGDRLAIWTVNTPETTRDLTGGFRDAQDARIGQAIDLLTTKEYAAGATDLKNGLKAVLRGFRDSGRQQIVLFLGDGESALNPLGDADRSALAAEMVNREITFFPIPLGPRLDPKTLHGLASGTGGAVLRLYGEEKVETFLPKLIAAFDAPVFYPSSKPIQFSEAITDAVPNRLPPLRGDAPTLVIGLMKPAETIGLKVHGSVAGKPTTVEIAERVPFADVSNYFLVNMLHQWQNADRSAPALVRADRGLALAFEQTRLAGVEVLTQAHWALNQNQLDAAQKLFEAAGKINPRDTEPQSGLKVVAKLKDGQITREQLRKQFNEGGMGLRIGGGDGVQNHKDVLVKLARDDAPFAAAPANPPAAQAGDLLELEKRRRQVQEQQVTQVVDETIKRARALVNSDPDTAYELLKRQLTSVRENTDLSDGLRATLAARLETALRAVVAEGALVKQRQEAELSRRLAEQARQAVDASRQTDDEKIRERVRSFGALMNQARFEEAYKEALVLQQEQISKGKPVPVQATTAYQMSLNSANLREFEELRRIKEDRILLTMMQVEKSHVPFPDEPPVEFPPAATWRAMTALRKDKYDAVGLEGAASRNALKIRDKLLQPASIEKTIDNVPLIDVLDFLSDKYELTFIIDVQAFDRDNANKMVRDAQVSLPKLPGVTLGTILRFLLAQVDGSLIIRRDYIEITTTNRTIAEKAVRAYPGADLVIPIPNGVNQQSLNQNLQVLGSSLSANGQAIFGQLGGGQALGFQGALGALGVLGPLGALGGGGAAIGGAAGIAGGVGGGIGGGGAGFQGGIGFGGGNNQTNLGFGGGTLGFGGGQQGQFGNLGGQFGLQGGDTSAILISLIQDVIAPKEWQQRAARYLFNNTNVGLDENEQPILNPDLLNSLGYYQPANALVVRATSRIQTRIGGVIGAGGKLGGMGAANRAPGDALVIRPGENRDRPAVAKAPVEPKPKPEDLLAKARADRDPAKVWHEAVDQGLLKPRQIIAVADVLAIGEKFDEAVALLKADLRKGVLAEPCVFEALALAMQASGGAPEEIERVRLSAIDIDPKNPQNFLAAAKAMQELGKPELAVAFCKRAAALEPNDADPYADSLVYLAKAKDVDTDAVQWAATNLLSRDWSVDRIGVQAQARMTLNDLIGKLRAAGKSAEADRLAAALHGESQRDLAIELIWSDAADLDLEVTEPTGGVRNPSRPQSTGGGVWRGDNMFAKDRAQANRETYIAAEAFNGSYEVRIKNVWGAPLGSKATIRVTRHQGAPNQTQELHRVEFGSDGTAAIKVRLDDGRRAHVATVPPPAPRRSPATASAARSDRVYNLLRSMSEPSFAHAPKNPMAGGTSANGAMPTQMMDVTPDIGPEVVRQNRLSTGMNSGADMQGQTVVSADRRSITMSMAPVFQTASSDPEVRVSSIPGGR